MKTLQIYLSALIDLFFPRFNPEEPEAEIPVRPWGELVGISLLFIGLIILMAITQ